MIYIHSITMVTIGRPELCGDINSTQVKFRHHIGQVAKLSLNSTQMAATRESKNGISKQRKEYFKQAQQRSGTRQAGKGALLITYYLFSEYL